MPLTRRSLLRLAGAALAPAARAESAAPQPSFRVDDAKYQAVYDAAVRAAEANVLTLSRYKEPVLIEGGPYRGVWLECAPQEGQVYAPWNAAAAAANQRSFFALQRADGQLPCLIHANRLGYAQIQMVVPIAATALEVAESTGDAQLLEQSYAACAGWDNWLQRYRNTRATGLCELFCEYDTGHDRSPRLSGLPHACPDGEARNLPAGNELPWLAPDLSATVYGGRIALARMARLLGKPDEGDRWLESAERIRQLIVDRLYDAKDGCFYDLTTANRFVRVRGDALTRVCGEHVVDAKLFGELWRRQLGNPAAFWAPYPFPSIALDDASFVRPIPQNSWGGASQALTALRAPRWMEHYGRYAELGQLMRQWTAAIARSGEFLQQMDPLTGGFTPHLGGYSPAILVLLDFTARLYGVQHTRAGLEWNCRLPAGATTVAASMPLPNGAAELKTTPKGSTLTLRGKRFARVTGAARVVTDEQGELRRMIGTEPTPQSVVVTMESGRKFTRTLQPNQVVVVLPSTRATLVTAD